MFFGGISPSGPTTEMGFLVWRLLYVEAMDCGLLVVRFLKIGFAPAGAELI